MNNPRRCDCLDGCGDDPRVARGAVDPCNRMLAWRVRPRILDVRRDADTPNVLVVYYDNPPTGDDVAYLSRCERQPWPQL